MPESSPAAPGLTSPWALRSRVLQALSTSEDVHRVLSSASGIHGLGLKSLVVFWVLFWLHRGYEVSSPESHLLIWRAMNSRSIWSSPWALGWAEGSGWGSNQSSKFIFQTFYCFPNHFEKHAIYDTYPAAPELRSKFHKFGIKGLKSWHVETFILMVKIESLI